MNDLIYEFFYEGIRRIIPGLVVMALYFHQEVVKVFDAHLDFSQVMLNACILLIAWVVGVVIEQIMAIPCALLWKIPCRECCLSSFQTWLRAQQGQNAKAHPDHETKKSAREKHEKRREGYLHFAAKTMCRSLWLTFAFAIFWYPEPFRNIQWNDSYFGIAGFVVFFISWLWLVVSDPDLQPTNHMKEHATSKSPQPATTWP